MHRRHHQSLIAALGLIAAGALLVGCGSGSQGTASHSGAASPAALAYSRCMRAHGVTGFPDPGARISGPYDSIGGIAFPVSIDMQSPAFQAAQNSCRGLLSAVLSPRGKPSITAALKESLVAHAQCMRTHGVPGYRDPVFPPGGGIMFTDGPGVNPVSPAYQHAQAACR